MIQVTKKFIAKAEKTELGHRIFSDKPKFWKKVQIIAAAVGTVGLLITTLPIGLPAGVIAWGTYLLTAGTAVAGVAQLPTVDKSDEEIKKAIDEGIKEAIK
jgi:hypothetical protein